MTMSGTQFRRIREGLGLTRPEWGRVLYYDATDASLERMMRVFENGHRALPERVAALADIYRRNPAELKRVLKRR